MKKKEVEDEKEGTVAQRIKHNIKHMRFHVGVLGFVFCFRQKKIFLFSDIKMVHFPQKLEKNG